MTRTTPLRASAQVMLFACAGSVGFAVDAALFWWVYAHGHAGVMVSRLLAFFPATVVTWLLNRSCAFRRERTGSAPKEYARYASIQLLGSALNFSVFYAAVRWLPEAAAMPLLPLAFASGVAMTFNFFGAKYLVYRR